MGPLKSFEDDNNGQVLRTGGAFCELMQIDEGFFENLIQNRDDLYYLPSDQMPLEYFQSPDWYDNNLNNIDPTTVNPENINQYNIDNNIIDGFDQFNIIDNDGGVNDNDNNNYDEDSYVICEDNKSFWEDCPSALYQ